MTEQKLVIYGFEFDGSNVAANGQPVPVIIARVQYPSGAQGQISWPLELEDQEFLKPLFDRLEERVLAQTDPNAAPGFVPEGLDDGFRKDTSE